MKEIAVRSEMQEIKKGTKIEVSDVESDYALLIKSGRLATNRVVGHKRTVHLDIVGPGDLLGAFLIVSDGEEPEQFEAIENCLVCKVRVGFLKEFIEENPVVSLSISARAGIRRRRIENRLVDVLFCTVPVRLARTIGTLADQFGTKKGTGTTIDLALTHQQLADLIGANREATSRAMRRLIDSGAVRYDGKRICVVDRAILDRIAER